MLANLQAVRAIAAIAVVIFHFGLLPVTSLSFPTGAAGVDLFFVLSGFIIAHSSTRDPRRFLAHRLIRVLPAYWIATVIAALFTLENLDVPEASGWLLQSAFYLPGPGGRPALIFVAWTLVYELAFYLLYWIALRAGPRLAPAIALVMLLAGALIPIPGVGGPWPLLIEFALGIAVYLIAERHAPARPLPGAAGLAIAAAGVALIVTLPQLTGYTPDDYQSIGRVLCWGLPSAIVMLGLVIAEAGGFRVRSRAVLLLGAASYAIYLLHPIAIGQLLRFPPQAYPPSWILCLIATVAIVAIAILFHLTIEAPLLRRMRKALRGSAGRGIA